MIVFNTNEPSRSFQAERSEKGQVGRTLGQIGPFEEHAERVPTSRWTIRTWWHHQSIIISSLAAGRAHWLLMPYRHWLADAQPSAGLFWLWISPCIIFFQSYTVLYKCHYIILHQSPSRISSPQRRWFGVGLCNEFLRLITETDSKPSGVRF